MALSLRTWPSRLLARPWLLAFVPINAATSGFGVVLPLLILITLHGSWADVAISATLYNSAVILMSIVWGHLTDRYPVRRTFLVINFAGFGILYAALSGVHSILELYALYAVVGAIAPAGTNASNLLILEKFGETERPNAFASYQEMAIIGSILGILIGYFWTLASEALLGLLLVLAGLAFVSAVAIWFGIREAPRKLLPEQVVRHPESLSSRLRMIGPFRTPVPFFPKRPSLKPGAWRRFRKWARAELHHEFPLIMAASFLFNLSGNLYNISYTPYLYSAGLAASAIFLVNLSNNFAQTLIFPFTGGLSTRSTPDRLVHRAAYLRSLGCLATAGFTFAAFSSTAAFEANLAIYAVLGAAIAVYTTASSLILFRSLVGRDAGSLIGINTALGGVAAVGGAALSALLSVIGSFRLVFFVSGGLLLVSLPLWTAATIAYTRRKYGRTPTDRAGKGPVSPTGADATAPTP
jgi:MFS family permease